MVAATFLCLPVIHNLSSCHSSICSLDLLWHFTYSKLAYVECITGLSRTYLNFIVVLVNIAALRTKHCNLPSI